MSFGWSASPGYAHGGTGTLHRLPEILPAPDTEAWEWLLPEIRRYFLSAMMDLRPRVNPSRVFICNPAQEAMIETLREIYNGEVEPPCDGEGNQYDHPRVWRWEHQLRIFWVIELPPSWTRRQFELQFAA
jgi:hypothetical protein